VTRVRAAAAAVGAPQDELVDRRTFLSRTAALAALASAGGLSATVSACASGARPGASSPEIAPRITNAAAYATSVRAAALADATELTIAEAALLIRRRRLSPLELVDAYLHRIARHEATYRAFNVVLYDSVRAEAQRLGSAPHTGPLHGIPLAIKDLFYTAGVATTANSLIFHDFVPDFDATVVRRLRAAGGLLLGKTQMGPLATTRATLPTGEITTVNAWAPAEPSVSPGGSSSGSATAVAGRLATSSLGTQTGGSITSPANAQALTGLKPTFGRVSVSGVIPLSYTRDHVGPIARDARDAAIVLQAIAGDDALDVRTHGLPPPPDYVAAATPMRRRGRTTLRWPTTIGVIPNYTDGDTPAAAARGAMLEMLERLGARVVEVTLPEDWAVLTGSAFNNVRLVERAEQLLAFLKQDVRLFGVSLPGWINGLLISGDEYLKGQRAKLLLLRRVLDDLFAQCDVVVQTSPIPFDIIGLPEIAFPIGFDTRNGRPHPIGAILGGRPYGEQRLLSIIAAYQAETDWHLRRPADPARASEPPAEARGVIRMEEVMGLME
jgi:Asp-tRNA(Asn)/Glu-tRNA(Gln) amidotransferase A subunit family amidase